jgi:hypothetical protein
VLHASLGAGRAERVQEDDYFRKHDQELMVALREKNAAEIE